jgi:hypothetical protein
VFQAESMSAHNLGAFLRFPGMEIQTSGGGMTKQAKWTFPVPPKWSMGTVKGDAFKMFRGETRELPGFLAARQPSASATLFIRELIQNSMDAHLEWRDTSPKSGRLDLAFEFDTISGVNLKEFIECAGLEQIVERVNSSKLEGQLGLTEEGWLGEANLKLPLSVLRVSENCTTGMYGPWEVMGNLPSKMRAALLDFGDNEKASDAGGSFGFGKAGLVKASRARMVIAYTCFDSPAPDDGATRRLYGVAYFGKHSLGNQKYTGFGGFGTAVPDKSAAAEGLTKSFVDDEADRIAEALGLEVRSVGTPNGSGTSFIIIDPDFDAVELRNAVEIFWWPALERNQLWTSIVDEGGENHPPRQKMDIDLKPFTEALEYAEGKTKPPPAKQCGVSSFKYRGKNLGNLGWVIDETPGSWSYSDDLSDVSMAALVRKTGLVIKYETTPTGLPKVRGVFSADSEVNDILRLSEPMSHSDWTDGKDSDIPEQSRAFAKKVKEDVRKSLREISSSFAPKSARPTAVLKQFNSYFGGSKPGGGGTGGHVRDPWSIEFEGASIESSPTGSAIFQTSNVRCGLRSGDEPVEVVVEFGFGASEGDQGFSTALLGCVVESNPAGFSSLPGEPNAFRGLLDVGTTSTFLLRSTDYDAEWSCGFQVSVTPWSDWKKSEMRSGSEEQ